MVGATPGDGQATLLWRAPLNTGASAITGYQVTVNPGAVTASAGAGATSVVVPGLVNELTYTATVRAINAVGTGPASAATAPFIPTSTAAVVRRDATNTGVLGVYDSTLGRNLTYADLTPYTGPTAISVAGTTLYRQDITGPITIAAHDVTLNQCRVRYPAGTPGAGVIRKATTLVPLRFRATDCEFDGQGVPRTAGVYPSGSAPSSAFGSGWGYTLIRCRVWRCTDLIDPSGNASGQPVVIQDSYLHEPIHTVGATSSAGSHNDLVQIASNGTAGGVFIQRSTLDAYTPAQPVAYTSSCTTFDGIQVGAVVTNFVLEDCYLNGAGYGVRPNSSASGTMTNCVGRRNRFGLNFQFGPKMSTLARANGIVDWQSSNVWDVTGTTDYGQAVVAGQVIA